ncbi:MAG TPA: RNA polymerase subunit sigma-24 [Treponema sp.]|jgi:RNA polymerase sigma-70 factor (ECF subfamily)|nr:RNA polymerase subunit sigma-24 [Treponema sp.]HBB43612.1 RNA polymerase subunit sigma-24 [Treponema sp.]HCA20436.1 RNA polymerase subunit sigma-24 [Treponema sp.]
MKTDGKRSDDAAHILRRDKALVKDVLHGKTESFATLMSLYVKRVQALGFSFFRNPTDTEDFVQDVFLKVYRHLESFRGESSFATWLTRIAYNTAINTRTRAKDVLPLEGEIELPSSIDTPEETQLRRFTREAVQEAVKELPDQYAVCLIFYFFHDFSYEEIAIITGFPVNTIKSHIFRAKKILRQKLKDYSVQ